MKRSLIFISVLSALCVLFAMVAFFLPNRDGMALSNMTIALAAAVGVLCVGAMIRLYFPHR